MQLERLRRGSKQVRGEETETLLAHIHLRKLVGETSDRGLPICWLLTKSWRIDVLWFLRSTSVVRRLCSGLGRGLLLRELAFRGETGGEELGRLSRLSGDGTVGWTRRSNHCVRAIVGLRLACCILSTLCMMRRLRGRRCTRRGIEAWAHGLGIREGWLPLCSTRRGF